MNAYEQGFMDKCAEAGVDPDKLIKRALNPMAIRGHYVQEAASVIPELARYLEQIAMRGQAIPPEVIEGLKKFKRIKTSPWYSTAKAIELSKPTAGVVQGGLA